MMDEELIIDKYSLIDFDFLNHKNEIEHRRALFVGISYGTSPHFPDKPAWFLVGECLDKNAIRKFKLDNISNLVKN